MEPNVGYYSASRQSWHENSVKELCAKLIEQHPKAQNDEALLIKLFKEAAREDDEYLEAAIDHAVHNTFNSLRKAKQRAQSQPAARAQRAAREQVTATVVESIKNQIFRMNITLPLTGKMLRDSTFRDCAKTGGWFAKVATKGQPNQIVGNVLTEGQLRAIK